MASATTHPLEIDTARLVRVALRPGTWIASLLLLAGVALLVHGLWIPAKAHLAQILLNHAWQRALAGEERPRPWNWADAWPVARLVIPSAGADFIVLSGTSGRSLAFGPGHMDGTPRPGEEGNSVISAHRDTQFSVLRELSRGAEIVVERPDGEIVSYRVDRELIVHEDDMSITESTLDTQLTLITCYPFDAIQPGSPYRYVVIARRLGSLSRGTI